MIAFDDLIGQEELMPFIKYVNLVKVEVLGSDFKQLKTIV